MAIIVEIMENSPPQPWFHIAKLYFYSLPKNERDRPTWNAVEGFVKNEYEKIKKEKYKKEAKELAETVDGGRNLKDIAMGLKAGTELAKSGIQAKVQKGIEEIKKAKETRLPIKSLPVKSAKKAVTSTIEAQISTSTEADAEKKRKQEIFEAGKVWKEKDIPNVIIKIQEEINKQDDKKLPKIRNISLALNTFTIAFDKFLKQKKEFETIKSSLNEKQMAAGLRILNNGLADLQNIKKNIVEATIKLGREDTVLYTMLDALTHIIITTAPIEISKEERQEIIAAEKKRKDEEAEAEERKDEEAEAEERKSEEAALKIIRTTAKKKTKAEAKAEAELEAEKELKLKIKKLQEEKKKIENFTNLLTKIESELYAEIPDPTATEIRMKKIKKIREDLAKLQKKEDKGREIASDDLDKEKQNLIEDLKTLQEKTITQLAYKLRLLPKINPPEPLKSKHRKKSKYLLYI